MNELREALAELEHEQWMKWAKNLMERENLSPDRIQRWEQLMIPYSQLTEEQKDQDRVWADKSLALYTEQIDAMIQEAKRTARKQERERISSLIVDDCDEIRDPETNELIYYAIKPGDVKALKEEQENGS